MKMSANFHVPVKNRVTRGDQTLKLISSFWWCYSKQAIRNESREAHARPAFATPTALRDLSIKQNQPKNRRTEFLEAGHHLNKFGKTTKIRFSYAASRAYMTTRRLKQSKLPLPYTPHESGTLSPPTSEGSCSSSTPPPRWPGSCPRTWRGP